jgi:hypothetical protein
MPLATRVITVVGLITAGRRECWGSQVNGAEGHRNNAVPFCFVRETPTGIARSLVISLMGPLLAVSVSAQTPPSVKDLIRGLRSQDESARMEAVELAVTEVSERRVSPLVDDPDFEKALLAALRRTNDSIRADMRKPAPPATTESGDGRRDDLNLFAPVFMVVVPSLSVRRQRAWAPELVRSLYSSPSAFATWLAEFGDVVLNDLVEGVNHPTRYEDRHDARAVLARMVAVTAAGPNARQTRLPLSVAGRQKALRAIRGGFDPGDSRSRELVQVFRELPSAEGLSLLQDFARRSQGVPEYSRPVRGGLKSLEEVVDDAIRTIQLTVGS